MEKKKQQPDKTIKENGVKNKTREEEAAEIMAMLVENNVFSQDEIAEVIFSDRTVICNPGEKDKTS